MECLKQSKTDNDDYLAIINKKLAQIYETEQVF